MSTDHVALWERFEATDADRYASFENWVNAADIPEALRERYRGLDPETWIPMTWRTFKALRSRPNPRAFISQPLAFPEATAPTDLFKAARFIVSPGVGKTRDEYQQHIDAHTGGPGFVYLSGHRAGDFSVTLLIGGKRDWSPQWLERGEHVRRHTGGQWSGIYVKPRPEVLNHWRKHIGYAFTSFEAIRWDTGHILILGRYEHGARWLALLEPGATALDLLPQEDRDLIARERAADEAAWGEAPRGA